MPISKDDDAWVEGAKPDRLPQEIIAFLHENSDKAFHERELADQFLGTEWAAGEETERLRDELSEEEFDTFALVEVVDLCPQPVLMSFLNLFKVAA